MIRTALALALAAFLLHSAAPPAAECKGGCGGYCSPTQLFCPLGCICNLVTNNCF